MTYFQVNVLLGPIYYLERNSQIINLLYVLSCSVVFDSLGHFGLYVACQAPQSVGPNAELDLVGLGPVILHF